MSGAGSDPGAIKACCSAAYRHDAVALLLGESYHPGGLPLTRRLADRLELHHGQRVADIASGPGTTARLLAGEYGVIVDGVDLNPSTVDTPGVRGHVGDAERVPLPDGQFDAVVCECAFCSFPDKAAAAREFARLLRHGGRVGLTDVTRAGPLPGELSGLGGWVACVADARPLADYVRLLADAGLRVTQAESHDRALDRMLDQIDARLRILGPGRLAAVDVDAVSVQRYLDLARRAVADGLIGYSLLVAEKA
jgi:arsenite methyltransferase